MDARRAAQAVVVLVALSAMLAAGVVVAPQALAADGCAYRVVDPSQVYLGNPRLFRKPAAVSADRVYRAIPEYQEILAKNLTDRDVRYHFLMRKASEKFVAAIRATATEGAYDLVAGIGAVVPEAADAPAPADVTDTVIAKLPAS